MKIKKLMLLVLASMAMGVMTGCGKTPQGGDQPGDVEVEKVTISFDANGGTGTMAAVQVDKGSEYTLPANGFTAPVEKHFKSWEVGGQAKEVGAKITVNANTTVKAVWEFNALPAEYDLLDHWEGNQAEEIYTVSKNAAGATVISYADATGEYSGGWEFVKRSFAYESTKLARFTEYKKIIFTGSMAVTAGTNFVMFKVEGADGNTFEQRFVFASEEKTYELGLNFISDWTKVQQLLFFANRSAAESGSGVITLSKFALSKEDVVPENDITGGTMPDAPQGYKPYNAVDTEATAKFDVDYHWGYVKGGQASGANIQVEALEGGIAKFSLTAGAKGSYEYVSSRVQNGKANLQDSGFKRIVFEVKGVAGQLGLFKFQVEDNSAAKEKGIKFTGEVQQVEVDITSVLAKEEATNFMACIFPQQGAETAVAGSIELTKCFMDKTEVTPDPVNVAKYPQVWLDRPAVADFCFDVAATPAEHKQVISFAKAASGYESIQYKLSIDEGWGVEHYRRVVAKVSADVNVHVLFKAFNENAGEKLVNLEANVPQYIDYLVPASIVAANKNFILFIGTDGADTLTGHVTIEGLRIVRDLASVDDANGVVRLNKVNNPGPYTPVENLDEDLEVSWDKTTGWSDKQWAGMELFFSALNPGSLNTIKGTLTATANVHVMFKPANQGGENEKKIALTAGSPVEISETFTAQLNDEWDGKVIVIICYEDADAKEGMVLLSDLRLTDGEHDMPARTAVLPVETEFHGLAKKAGKNEFFPIDYYFDEVSALSLYYNGEKLTILGAMFYSRTGYYAVATSEMKHIVVKYDATNNVLMNLVTDDETEAANIDSSYPIHLSGNCLFYGLDGAQTELRNQIKRRYMSGSWQTNNVTDEKMFVDTEHYIRGSALKNNGWTGGAIAINLMQDIPNGVKAKSFGFWVYNPSQTAVKLRMWIYMGAGLGDPKQELASSSGVEINKEGWTFLQYGVAGYLTDNKVMYNFQIADFTNSGVALTYDNICIYM